MKIAHISDIHLGYTSGNKVHPTTRINLREQDGYDAFNECIDSIIAEKVDLVLCTGDLFHTPNPSTRTIRTAQETLFKLSDCGIKFIDLAGNHDATDSVKDVPANRILHIPQLNLFSFTEPYITYDVGEDIVIHLVSHHGYIEQEKTMQEVNPIIGKFNILATHGSCFDDNIGLVLHTELSPREVIIPEYVLEKNWDYILMGHIHERGWVGSKDGLTDTTRKKRFYGGSLIRRGFSDKECKLGRGWTLWDIKNGEMTPTFFNVSQRPQYDITINCEEKTVMEIEDDIIKKLTEINLEDTPIVRITMINSSMRQKTSMDYKRLDEYTKKCLTFSIKVITKEDVKELVKNEQVQNSFNLIQSFQEFCKDKTTKSEKEEVVKLSSKLLQEGQNKILEKA